MNDGTVRWLKRMTGAFLIFVGLAFALLFTFLKVTVLLPSDLRVSASMLGISGVLIWVGSRFVKSTPEITENYGGDEPGPLALKFRRPAELVAAVGTVFLLGWIVATFRSFLWPAQPLLTPVLAAPVLIGLFIQRIRTPEEFLFTTEFVEGWSPSTNRLVSVMFGVARLGYPAIAVAWYGLDKYAPEPWGRIVRLAACCLIFILYASQFFVLHLGNIRK